MRCVHRRAQKQGDTGLGGGHVSQASLDGHAAPRASRRCLGRWPCRSHVHFHLLSHSHMYHFPGLVEMKQSIILTVSYWEGLGPGETVDAATFSHAHIDYALLWQPTLHAVPPSPDFMGADALAPFFGVGNMPPSKQVGEEYPLC